MKVALVHDFISEYGGAERVLEALHEVFPEAPVYTAWCDLKSLGPHAERFKDWDIRVSWAKKLPFFGKLISPFRIFAPLFFESLNLEGYDLVISSSSPYFGKGVITSPRTIHICYCHTPPRFLYGYLTAIDWRKYWWINAAASLFNLWLRVYDYWSAQRVDYFLANSREVASRIYKFYRREATVIYPPVDVERFKNYKADKVHNTNYFLVVSRLTYSKRIDLAIRAVGLLGLNLKIIGKGREEGKLRKLAQEFSRNTNQIEFLGEVNDEELIYYYKSCQAVIFPAEDEDFGIVPIEAMACGKPVIAYASGGVLETIIPHVTGEFFTQPTYESLSDVLKYFDHSKYSQKECISQADKFSKTRFKKEIIKFIGDKLKQRRID